MSLSQLITEEHVTLRSTPDDWQEAIRLVSLPLLTSGSITQGYVERMIDMVLRYGPYIVLVPGVALAHAQADGDVLRTSMSAMTIPDGVAFGHTDHDPVRLLLCLAAPDSGSHLEALRVLVQILRHPSTIAALVAAQDPTAFRALLD